ncbi:MULTISPECIES: hypothetical protein [unclassified Endozoicomonas]|uniref:hypothetical protein n=1 Tax=unclassified Endozoicomonas TaxID=2644528 RepID=UPI003BB50BEE
MKTFFSNLLTWLVPKYDNGTQSIDVASNIEKGHAFRFDGSQMKGQIYDFVVNKSYRLDNLTSISKGGFAGLDARSTLVLLRQSFEITIHNNDQDYASLVVPR